MKIISASLAIFAASATLTAIANEWVTLRHGNDDSVVYETSLIDESGFFSKDFSVWLKVTYEINVDVCGNPPDGYHIGGDGSAYRLCMSKVSRSPKEIVYKVSFNCDKKTVLPLVASSVNIHGGFVNPTLQIGSHPGSLGYSLVERYCK